MQILIERALHVTPSPIAVHLYLVGARNLELKYLDELMGQIRARTASGYREQPRTSEGASSNECSQLGSDSTPP